LSREREFRMNRLDWWEGSWVSGYGLWLERLIMKKEKAWDVSLPPLPPLIDREGRGEVMFFKNNIGTFPLKFWSNFSP
jgi:hypothetical protein